MQLVCEETCKDTKKGFVMAKKKKIHVGWVVVELNKAGFWKAIIDTTDKTRIGSIQHYLWSLGYYKPNGRWKKLCRAGTLKVKKMYVTI